MYFCMLSQSSSKLYATSYRSKQTTVDVSVEWITPGINTLYIPTMASELDNAS